LPNGRQPCILVVDDEPSVLTLLEIALREYGFVVLSALGGEKAVRLFEEHQASIDLVLLDVQMPRLDGVQTLQRLRALAPDVRCCLMSGSTGRYSQADLMALGVVRVLDKPFSSMHHLATTLLQVASPVHQEGPR
jgi:CheY-like chemotaxis protein